MSDLTCTNADIWNAFFSTDPAKPGPLPELVSLDTPLPASNQLRRSLRLAQAEWQALAADYQKLLDRFGEKDEAGKFVPSEDGKRIMLNDKQEFEQEMAKLLAVEVTLPGVVPVPVSSLGKIAFSGRKLDLLSKFVPDDV